MKKLTPYVRVVLIFGLIFFFVEYFIDSEKPAFIEFPLVALFLSLILFVLIAIEVTYGAIENIVYQLLDEKQKEEFLKERSFTDSHSSYKKWMRWLTKSKPVEQNEEILREHDFDGIQELDNALPPWWLYGFYFTIIFAVVYLVRFHVLGGDNQIQEFDKALTEANAAVQEYKKNNPDLILLDIIMPIMDGMTMLKELRKTKFGKDVPVIILTNSNNDDSLSESLASGAYDFLIKSNWKIQEVVDKVKERLGA